MKEQGGVCGRIGVSGYKTFWGAATEWDQWDNRTYKSAPLRLIRLKGSDAVLAPKRPQFLLAPGFLLLVLFLDP